MPYAEDDIASRIPSPDKLGKGGKATAMPPEEEAEDKAARVSQMAELREALNSGDDEAACNALEQYLDTAGYRR